MSIRQFLNDNGDFVIDDIQCRNLVVNRINGLTYLPNVNQNPIGGMASQICYTNLSNQQQTFPQNSGTVVIWNNLNSDNSFGTSNITLQSDNATFKNTSANPIIVSVNVFISYGNTNSSNIYVHYASVNNTERIAVDTKTGSGILLYSTLSFVYLLNPNDEFAIYNWTNDSSGVVINANSFQTPASQITISQFVQTPSGGDTPAAIENINDVLQNGEDANNQNIVNLNTLDVNTITMGNTASNYFQLQYSNNSLTIKQFNSTNLLSNSLTLNSDGSVSLSSNGKLYVNNGSVVGRVYDDKIYTPPAVPSGSSSIMSWTNNRIPTNIQTITQNTPTQVTWFNADSSHTNGDFLVFDGVNKFTYPSSNTSSTTVSISSTLSFGDPSDNFSDNTIRLYWASINTTTWNGSAPQYGLVQVVNNSGFVLNLQTTVQLNPSDFIIMYASLAQSDITEQLNIYVGSRISFTQLQ